MADTDYTNEIWRAIDGHPDYAVSDFGRVQRVAPDCKGRFGGRILSHKISKFGYHIVTLTTGGTPKMMLVSRLVCAAFHGPEPEPKMHAAHGDRDKDNNTPANLRWATAKENGQDKVKHGTSPRGDRHGTKTKPGCNVRGERVNTAKLTASDIPTIRADGRTLHKIAADYGVTFSAIHAIKSRKNWKHIA